MLHPVVVGLLLGGPGWAGTPADAGPRPLRRGWQAPLTFEARVALARRIDPQIVEIRRHRSSPMVGLVEPHIAGWWVARGRVVTSAWLMLGWPTDPSDRIEVRRRGGAWRPAAVGLLDLHIGYAVLDVPSLAAPGVPTATQPPAPGAVAPSVTLYTAFGDRLVAAPVGALGTGERAYYFDVPGAPLPVGTPLFDTDGVFVTVIGLPSESPRSAGLALPDRATTQLFERALEWR